MTKEEFKRAREICRSFIVGDYSEMDTARLLAEEYTPKALDRIQELEREVEALRQYGNKDCTAQADEYLEQLRKAI